MIYLEQMQMKSVTMNLNVSSILKPCNQEQDVVPSIDTTSFYFIILHRITACRPCFDTEINFNAVERPKTTSLSK